MHMRAYLVCARWGGQGPPRAVEPMMMMMMMMTTYVHGKFMLYIYDSAAKH